METPCPIRHLALRTWGEVPTYARSLIGRCTELRYLDVNLFNLSFRFEASLPTFVKLREIRVDRVNLHLIAPLLLKAPNLRTLGLSDVTDWPPESPSLVYYIGDIPLPAFMLKCLHVFGCLKVGHSAWKWLFSTSHAIDYVELQNLESLMV